MMDFITVPLVVGIVCTGIYGLFELFVRRKERVAIIEKIGDKLESTALEKKLDFSFGWQTFSFSALKAGCLLAGVGLGLFLGILLFLYLGNGITAASLTWSQGEFLAGLCGAFIFFFGGLGLIVAFIIEMKSSKKSKE